jgi:hypothetical protein
MSRTIKPGIVPRYISMGLALFVAVSLVDGAAQTRSPSNALDDAIVKDAMQMLAEGKQTFRFDTFGSEAFWGEQLKLHQAIEGAKLVLQRICSIRRGRLG